MRDGVEAASAHIDREPFLAKHTREEARQFLVVLEDKRFHGAPRTRVRRDRARHRRVRAGAPCPRKSTTTS